MSTTRVFYVAVLHCVIAPWASAQSASEFEAVLARYGNINTIAGSGLRDNCTDWLPGHEGGAATSADLSRPHMAAADADGRVYIADKEAFAIRRVDVDGSIHTIAGNGVFGVPSTPAVATQVPLWGPNGLFVMPNGNIYFLTVNDNCVSVLAGGKIHRITPDGTLTTVVDDPALNSGRGLYVSDDEQTIYYASGTTLRKWTSADGATDFATGFVNLGNIDLEPSGTLLATDRFGHRVWRVEADGDKTVVAGNGSTSGGGSGQLATATGLNEVRGVAAFDTGGFLVCTHRASQVWYVDTAGYIWRFIDGDRSDSTHSGDGQPVSTPGLKISEPRAVTVAPNGDLLITENDNGYVRRVTNVAVEPRILEFGVDRESGTLLEWSSHREASYRVEASGDLRSWSLLTTVAAGNGVRTAYSHDPEGAPAVAYRVVELER